MSYWGVVRWSSGEQTLASGASLTISHGTLFSPPVVTGWTTATSGGGSAKHLLHFDASAVDTGSTPLSWTLTNAAVVASPAKFGGGSLQIDPATDSAQSEQTTTRRNAGHAWSVSAWARVTALGAFRVIMDSAGDWQWLMSGGQWYFAPNGAGIATGVNAVVDTWTHLEACCDGSRLYLFVDGVKVYDQAYSSSIGDNSRRWHIGNYSSLTSSVSGYVDELAIWDSCLHTANFTPPAAPYSDATTYRTVLALGVDFSAQVNGDGDVTTITNTSGGSITGTWEVRA